MLQADPSNSTPPLPAAPAQSERPLWQDLLLLLFFIIVLISLAAAIILPWREYLPGAGSGPSTYPPLADGEAYLQLTFAPDGQPQRWSSTNIYAVPIRQALSGGLRGSVALALEQTYPGALTTGDIPGVDIFEMRNRIQQASGEFQNESVVVARDANGVRMVNFYQTEQRLDTNFTPPLPLYPATMESGVHWQGIGQLADQFGYQVDGELGEQQPYTISLGVFSNCLPMQSRTVVTDSALPPESQRVSEIVTASWECEDIGSIAWKTLDGQGVETDHGELLATTALPGRVGDLAWTPPIQISQLDAPPLADPASWELKRLARLTSLYRTAASATFPPVFVPLEQPLLLGAALGGDLLALDANSGAIRWRFHTGGNVFSPPVVDQERMRIYFGSSDKSLYAVDLNGMFLWSFATGDNIASRPLVVGSSVIFGSEDRSLYAVDAQTGALRWQTTTGGPVVSSPALAAAENGEPLVIAGSDDGIVYALNVADGTPRWQFAAEGAVEAAIVVADDINHDIDSPVAYVAARDGFLYALNAASGELLWQSELDSPLRMAPAVGMDNLYVVDNRSRLHAVRRANGARLWTLADEEYSGVPLALNIAEEGENVVVTRYRGSVDLLDPNGNRLQSWENADARLVVDGEDPRYVFGPTAGGDALWLADDTGVVQRLGQPAASGEQTAFQVELAWVLPSNLYPFESELLATTPVTAGDHLLLFDQASNLYRLDVGADGESAEARKLGTVQGGASVHTLDPILAGDTLLAVLNEELYAVDAATATARWHVTGTYNVPRAPVADDDTVIWLTVGVTETGIGPGLLRALSLEDGTEQWRVELEPQPYIGGAAIHNDTVVASSPPSAYDRATGETLWSKPEISGLGIPAVAATGATLYAGSYDPATQIGSVLALDLATGAERWQASLGSGNALNPPERIWPSGDAVVVPAVDGSVYGFAAADGSLLWHITLDTPYIGAITVERGIVYALLQNGDLLLLDAASGQLLAQAGGYEVNLADLSFGQRPAVLDNIVAGAVGLTVIGFDVTPGQPNP
jgi:outer membrane protein assembly factor BamB